MAYEHDLLNAVAENEYLLAWQTHCVDLDPVDTRDWLVGVATIAMQVPDLDEWLEKTSSDQRNNLRERLSRIAARRGLQ